MRDASELTSQSPGDGRVSRDERAERVPKVERAPRAPRVAYAVAVLAICAVFPVFVSGAVGYVPLGIAVFMMLISGLYLLLVGGRVDCAQRVRLFEYVRGQGDVLSVSVRNTSALPLLRVEPTFVVQQEGGEPSTLRLRSALAPRGEHAFRLDIDFDHVGVYEVGLRAMEVYDLLGLFSRVVSVGERCRVRVVPRVTSAGDLGVDNPTVTDAVRSVRTVMSDDMDYAFVREYQMGDPMKRVHWKMSARGTGHLYTKLFESSTNPGTTVMVDLSASEAGMTGAASAGAAGSEAALERAACLYDALLETAWSTLDFAARTGVSATLSFLDRAGELRCVRMSRVSELGRLVEEMPRLGATSPRATADMLEREFALPDAQANLVFVTSDLAAECVEALVRQRSRHRGVRVLVVLPAGLTASERATRMRYAERLSAACVEVVSVDAATMLSGEAAVPGEPDSPDSPRGGRR